MRLVASLMAVTGAVSWKSNCAGKRSAAALPGWANGVMVTDRFPRRLPVRKGAEGCSYAVLWFGLDSSRN